MHACMQSPIYLSILRSIRNKVSAAWRIAILYTALYTECHSATEPILVFYNFHPAYTLGTVHVFYTYMLLICLQYNPINADKRSQASLRQSPKATCTTALHNPWATRQGCCCCCCFWRWCCCYGGFKSQIISSIWPYIIIYAASRRPNWHPVSFALGQLAYLFFRLL